MDHSTTSTAAPDNEAFRTYSESHNVVFQMYTKQTGIVESSGKAYAGGIGPRRLVGPSSVKVLGLNIAQYDPKILVVARGIVQGASRTM